jgi:hypothetical protein
MGECNHAGRRPAAYYRFELGIAPPRRWYGELATLLDHNLIDAEEAVRLERIHYMLSEKYGEVFCAAYDDEDHVRRLGLNALTGESLAEQFDVAARWHERRGRPELADTYRARARIVREAGQANPIKAIQINEGWKGSAL